MCVCVCVRERERVCVCVRERERERERESVCERETFSMRALSPASLGLWSTESAIALPCAHHPTFQTQSKVVAQ